VAALLAEGCWPIELSMHVYFGALPSLFGLNPLPFHIVNLSLHTLNTLLVGWVWLKISGNR